MPKGQQCLLLPNTKAWHGAGLKLRSPQILYKLHLINVNAAKPDCDPGLMFVAIHVENPTLIPGALLVRPAQHKSEDKELEALFCHIFARNRRYKLRLTN